MPIRKKELIRTWEWLYGGVKGRAVLLLLLSVMIALIFGFSGTALVLVTAGACAVFWSFIRR